MSIIKGTTFYSYCSPVFPIFANNTTNWLQEVTDFSNTGHLSYPNNFHSVNCQPMSFCLFHSLSYYCYYPFQVSIRFPLSYVLLQLLNWSPASNLSLFRSNCDSRTESISPLYKWHHKVSLMSGVQLFVTLSTVACQDPLSMGLFQARILEWVAFSSSKGTSQPRDRPRDLTRLSCISVIGRGSLYHWATWEAHDKCDVCKMKSSLPHRCSRALITWLNPILSTSSTTLSSRYPRSPNFP